MPRYKYPKRKKSGLDLTFCRDRAFYMFFFFLRGMSLTFLRDPDPEKSTSTPPFYRGSADVMVSQKG